jgi:hypothetical protein
MSRHYDDIENYLYDPDQENVVIYSDKEILYKVVNSFAFITYIILFLIAVYVMSRSFTNEYDAIYLQVASLVVFWVAPVVVTIVYLFSGSTGTISLIALIIFAVSILSLSSYQIAVSTDTLTLGLSGTYTAMTSILLTLWFVSMVVEFVSFYKKRYVYGVKTEEFGSDEIDF